MVSLHVGCGAQFVRDARPQTYDSIVIDAAKHDATDEGEEMEAPPLPFYSLEFLRGCSFAPCYRAALLARPFPSTATGAIARGRTILDHSRTRPRERASMCLPLPQAAAQLAQGRRVRRNERHRAAGAVGRAM